MVGGALAASILAITGLASDAPAKSARQEACLPQGRRCGTRKGDESCSRCCQRYHVTNPKGRRKCACRPLNETCNNSAQCCTGSCQNSVCVSGSTCTAVGGACQNNGDCCTSTCGDNICQSVVCANIGTSCTTNANCCSNVCADNLITFICRKPNCVAEDQPCQNDTDCCDGFCFDDGSGGICVGCGCPPA